MVHQNAGDRLPSDLARYPLFPLTSVGTSGRQPSFGSRPGTRLQYLHSFLISTARSFRPAIGKGLRFSFLDLSGFIPDPRLRPGQGLQSA